MLSETSGDFAEAPEHPNMAPLARRVNEASNNLVVFIFFLLSRSRLNPAE
jgi:hypothetical protein